MSEIESLIADLESKSARLVLLHKAACARRATPKDKVAYATLQAEASELDRRIRAWREAHPNVRV